MERRSLASGPRTSRALEASRHVEHAAAPRPIGSGATLFVLRRRVGAGRNEQLHDLHRFRLVIGKPPERRVAVFADGLGEAAIRRQAGAHALTLAAETQ